MTPSTIHVIFKTHLDVGFTDLAERVVARYLEHFIPQALNLAAALRAEGGSDRFVWTTGSWLIYQMLEHGSTADRRKLEAAIAAGDIAWHALPFTTHSELMDPDLLRAGLGIAQELDRRFGRRTIAAKMTDVPGHTRGMVSLLAAAGVRFLHIGVNAASTAPAVPPIFVWRDPSGAEIIVMYHKGSYGDLMQAPGLADAIYFAHSNDNEGPQSPEAVHAVFAALRRRLPGAEPVASTMDAFAARLLTIRDHLPVVTQEIGDTWIHGVGSDPQKVAAFRALLRLRRGWLADGRAAPDDLQLRRFERTLLLVPEHTWGLDVKTHLADWTHYDAREFAAVRKQPNFQLMEESWQEQRGYLDQAVNGLTDRALRQEASACLAGLAPSRPALDGLHSIRSLDQPLEGTHFRLRFDGETGAITGLLDKSSGRRWASPRHPLGLLAYQTYDAADYARFRRQYNNPDPAIAWWSIPDFTKPGIDAAAVARRWPFRLTAAYHGRDDAGERLVLLLAGDPDAQARFGCPQEAAVTVALPAAAPALQITLQWFAKPVCRLPEALWFSFTPLVRAGGAWLLDKLGEAVSPLDVVADGNRKLHAVGEDVRYHDAAGSLTIASLDAPLVAPGRPGLLTFDNRQPSRHGGMHFLLYNNVWGTNFPMWSGEDACFRFVVQ